MFVACPTAMSIHRPANNSLVCNTASFGEAFAEKGSCGLTVPPLNPAVACSPPFTPIDPTQESVVVCLRMMMVDQPARSTVWQAEYSLWIAIVREVHQVHRDGAKVFGPSYRLMRPWPMAVRETSGDLQCTQGADHNTADH